jgi:hypothetical protein
MDRIDGDILINGTAYVYGLASKSSAPLLRSRDVNQFHVAKYFHRSSGGPDTQWIHSVRGASGLVKYVRFGALDPSTEDATITVDVKKNGTTILQNPIRLTSAQTSGEEVAGALADSQLVRDDILTVVLTATSGTSGGMIGSGVFGSVWIDEDYPTS